MYAELIFDALELARRANPEIDDMRRMAREQELAERPSAGDGHALSVAVVRAFRSLAKGD